MQANGRLVWRNDAPIHDEKKTLEDGNIETEIRKWLNLSYQSG